MRTERPRKAKIGTEVAHVTRDSDTTFKVKRSKVNLQGGEAYCGGLPHSLLTMALISGADVSVPAFEVQEDSFNIHCDISYQKHY